MHSTDNYNESNITDTIFKQAPEVTANLLPNKSKDRYESEYSQFCQWKNNREIKQVNDDVLLVYLSEKAKQLKPTSLWSKFSMLKNCISLKENVHLNNFPKTIAFLKRQSTGYTPKKSKILTLEQVKQFLNEAPDENWLLGKIILILGIFGACRRDDLLRLTLNDIEDNGRYLVVFLPDGKTRIPRSFTITNDRCSFKPCDLYRKYVGLRPMNMGSKRLLIRYRNGKCLAQNVGSHTISALPSNIAKYLNLTNPEEYTGHCFRRTSESFLVEGGDLLALKIHRGWRSSTTTEYYIEDSIDCKMIEESMDLDLSTDIKQEPDKESTATTPCRVPTPVQEPFEAVYFNSQLNQDFAAASHVNTDHPMVRESETIAPDFYCPKIKTEPLESSQEAEVDKPFEDTSEWSCPICFGSFDSERSMEHHIKQRHPKSDLAQSLVKKMETPSLNEHSTFSSSQSSPAYSLTNSTLISTVQCASTYVPSLTTNGSGAQNFLILPAQQCSPITIVSYPNLLHTSPLVPTTISVSSEAQNQCPEPAPLSEPQTQHSLGSVINASDILSISLAAFSDEERMGIKKKIIEILNAVAEKRISPDNIIIAVKGEPKT